VPDYSACVCLADRAVQARPWYVDGRLPLVVLSVAAGSFYAYPTGEIRTTTLCHLSAPASAGAFLHL